VIAAPSPLLGRLLHKSHVLDIRGRSYRLRDLDRTATASRSPR